MKIYLACPYMHEDEDIMTERYEKVTKIAAKLINIGYIIFSPLSHCHVMAGWEEMPKTFDYWEKYDRAFIEWADEVWVLKLPGWRESVGVTAELKIAKELNKSIRLINYNDPFTFKKPPKIKTNDILDLNNNKSMKNIVYKFKQGL